MHRLLAATALAVVASAGTGAPPQLTPAQRDATHAMYEHVINTPTVIGRHNVPGMAQYVADQFTAAGFPAADVHVVPYHTGSATTGDDDTAALIVRWRAAGAPKAKPIMLMGHMDVVEAKPEDWSVDPFKMIEKDGYYYGRGTQDMKDGDAALVTTFLRLHRDGYKPKRDLILALTADEEGGSFNGAKWLVEQHRDLVDAAFVINPDAGGIELEHGRTIVAAVEATEKVYSDFQVTAVNRGGHSSLPRPDNAIYELTTALNKLAAYAFPFELNGVTRAYFTKLAEQEKGQTATDIRAMLATPPDREAIARLSNEPSFNSNLRTTCVATRLNAGVANNALPQTAQAIVNCRIFPGHSPEEIRHKLIDLFGDDKLSVKYVSDSGEVSDTAPNRIQIVPPAPIPEVFEPLTRITQAIWPGVPVTAVMENGASDSIHFAEAGISSYGFSAIALERSDDRAHGRDERLPIDSYFKSVDFFYEFAKALGGE
jgi:acetylornithine deacetylase/succinyl-diaminopimelate desuccinylase-like protein